MNGVTRLLSGAMDYDTFVQTILLARQYETTILAAMSVVSNPTLDLIKFERLLDENREHVKAISEIGLDGKYTQDDEKRRPRKKSSSSF